MLYYVALDNELAHCTCQGTERFHWSGNKVCYGCQWRTRDIMKSYVEIPNSTILKSRILNSFAYKIAIIVKLHLAPEEKWYDF